MSAEHAGPRTWLGYAGEALAEIHSPAALLGLGDMSAGNLHPQSHRKVRESQADSRIRSKRQAVLGDCAIEAVRVIEVQPPASVRKSHQTGLPADARKQVAARPGLWSEVQAVGRDRAQQGRLSRARVPEVIKAKPPVGQLRNVGVGDTVGGRLSKVRGRQTSSRLFDPIPVCGG